MYATSGTKIYADASTASGVKMTLPAGTQMMMNDVILGPDGNPAGILSRKIVSERSGTDSFPHQWCVVRALTKIVPQAEQLSAKKWHSDVESVTFSADGNILASGSTDKTIKLWDVASVLQKYSSAS